MTGLELLIALLGFLAGSTATYAWIKAREARAWRQKYLGALGEAKRLEARLKSMLSREEPLDVDARILELRAKGYSLRQIAREVGLSHTAVWLRLKRLEAGKPSRAEGQKPKPIALEA